MYYLGFGDGIGLAIVRPRNSLLLPPCIRPMPCLLPEVLLPWLIERGIFGDIKDNEVRRYWQHHRSAKTCLAHVCETDDAIPIWLWGDAAQYNAKNESVVVLCCGCILDQRKASVSTCFPFVILREDPGLYLKYHFDNVHICYIYIYFQC